MKKFLVILILSSNTQLLCMEKDLQPLLLQQLPLELKITILKKTTSINAETSIDSFKRLRLVSKQFNNKESITTFIEILNTEFPKQEIRFARAFHNEFAQKWLSEKYPTLSYQPSPLKRDKAKKIVLTNDIDNLKKNLLNGYNPKEIKTAIILHAHPNSKLEFLKLSISFGASPNDIVDIFTLQEQIRIAKLNNQLDWANSLHKIIDFLTLQQHQKLQPMNNLLNKLLLRTLDEEKR